MSELLSGSDCIIWNGHLEKTSIRANRGAESAPRYSGNADFVGEIRHRSADLVPLLIGGVNSGRKQ